MFLPPAPYSKFGTQGENGVGGDLKNKLQDAIERKALSAYLAHIRSNH